MKANPTRLFLQVIFLLTIGLNLIQCFIQKKYEIQDLTTNSQLCFQKEVKSWSTSVIDPKSSMYSKCQETFILGGFDWSPTVKQPYQTLQRLYTGLPEHKYLRFTFSFWAMDSWDYYNSGSYDRFELQFDSLPVINGWGMKSDTWNNKFCGNGKYLDLPGVRGFGWIEHSGESLLLIFRSRMDQETTDESFGIREIKFIFADTMPSGPNLCAYTGGPPVYQHTPCACPTGKYSGSSGCENCHEDCESCYGFGPDKCYACAKGRYFYGEKCVICDSSCAECMGSGVQECTACDMGKVLFNGRCIAETRCKSPMMLDECSKDCQSPCSSQKMTLWEEFCFPSCPDKEISNLEANCIRCESLIAQYLKATDVGHQYTIKLYPSSCDLDIQTVRRFLKITEETKGSVGSFDFEITKTGTNQYFVDLVLGGNVLEPTTLDVKLSYLQGILPVPKKFIPNPTLQEIAKMIPAAKGALTGFTSGSIIGSLLIGASASLWSIISFQQFVGYFIYINIEFPFQTELFLMLLQSSLWDMLPNPLAKMMSSLSKNILKEDADAVTIYDPPAKFVKYNVSSFFVENGGTIVAVNLALPVLLLLVVLVRKTKFLKESYVLERIERFLRWNFITRSFLENGIPLSLAVFLQFRIMMFNNLYLTLCCAFAIFSFLLTAGSIFALWFVLRKKNNHELKKSNFEEVFGTLYEGIVLTGGPSKYYNIVILLRGILVVCLVSFFEAVPLFQIAPLILFNVSLVYYMFNHVPFEDKKLTKIVRIKELFILFAELCIFCLLFGGKSQFYYDFIGYLVLGFLGSALAIEMIYMFALQIIELKNLPRNVKRIWKEMKGFLNKCLRKRKSPSIKTKHRLDTTVVRIRPHDTSAELSSLTFRSENRSEIKFKEQSWGG